MCRITHVHDDTGIVNQDHNDDLAPLGEESREFTGMITVALPTPFHELSHD
jgi:hypothetical protein